MEHFLENSRVTSNFGIRLKDSYVDTLMPKKNLNEKNKWTFRTFAGSGVSCQLRQCHTFSPQNSGCRRIASPEDAARRTRDDPPPGRRRWRDRVDAGIVRRRLERRSPRRNTRTNTETAEGGAQRAARRPPGPWRRGDGARWCRAETQERERRRDCRGRDDARPSTQRAGPPTKKRRRRKGSPMQSRRMDCSRPANFSRFADMPASLLVKRKIMLIFASRRRGSPAHGPTQFPPTCILSKEAAASFRRQGRTEPP